MTECLSRWEFEEHVEKRCCVLLLDESYKIFGDTLTVIVDGKQYTLKVEWKKETTDDCHA